VQPSFETPTDTMTVSLNVGLYAIDVPMHARVREADILNT